VSRQKPKHNESGFSEIPDTTHLQAQREFENRYLALFEHSIDAILLTVPDGSILAANPAACAMFGQTEEEICRLGRTALVDVTDPRLPAALEERRRTGKFQGELTYLRKDGSRFSGEVTSVIFKDAEGRERSSMIVRDISERQSAEEMLRRRAAELLAVHQASQRLQLLHSPEELAQEIIRVLEGAIGYEFGAVLLIDEGTHHLKPFAISDQGKGSAFIQSDKDYISSQAPQLGRGITGWVVQTGESVRLGDVTQDPRYFSMRTDIRSELCVPLRVDARIIGVVNVETSRPDAYSEADQRVLETIAAQIGIAIQNAQLFADVQKELAERKQAQESLLESEENFKYIFDHSMIGKSLTHLTGELNVNQAFCQMLGYTAEELINKRWQEITHPEDVARNEKVIESFEAGEKESARFIKRYIHKNGSPVWVDMVTSLRRDTMGNPLYLITEVMDITEQKRAEEEIRRRLKDLWVLYETSQSFGRCSTPQEIGHQIVGILDENLNWHHTVVRMKKEESDELEIIGFNTMGISPENLAVEQSRLSRVLNRVGQGLSGWVVQNDQTIRRSDLFSEPRHIAIFPNMRSGLYAPMKTDDQIIGVISVESEAVDAFDDKDQRLIETIAEVASGAIHRLRLRTQTERQLNRLEALRSIDMAITSVNDLTVMLKLMLTQIVAQLEVDAANFLLLNPSTQILEYKASRGFRSPVSLGFSEHLMDGVAGQAAMERKIIRESGERGLQNIRGIRAQKIREEGFVAHIAAPLIAKGQVKGVLELFHRSPLTPNGEWWNFLEMLTDQAAIAIDNVSLFESLQQSTMELTMAYDETIEGWSNAMDLRDKETEGHTQRVAALALQLASHAGLGAEEMVHFRRGALLHDIGKIGVPDEILRKPGPLSDEEWAVMRAHPQLAHDMLAPIRYLRSALDIPYCHHENWDGTGYPRGLAGEQIPLAARIFSVADVYDALTSDRPYRMAWSQQQAMDFIKEQAGKKFDPRIVDVFTGYHRVLDSE